MKALHHFTFAAVLGLTVPAVLAADEADHVAHHAGGAAPSATTAAAADSAGQEAMRKMDAQMKAMGEMHNKMMSATSPEERKAMMTAHMKTMQDSMKMMGGMGAMNPTGGTAKMKKMVPGAMAMHHQMMEKRMDMMEMMMRMMMDRLPAQ